MLNDAELRRNVEHELSCVARLGPPAIVVSVRHGVVTLSGVAPDFVGKIQAGRCAAGVAGVAGVLNKVEVAPVGRVRSDADLARAALAAVKAQLPSSADAVTVAAQNGVLRLEGMLGWNYQRKRAEEAVYGLRGVRGVENRIALAPAGPAGEIRWKRRFPSHALGGVQALGQNGAAQPGASPLLAQGPMPAPQGGHRWPDAEQGGGKHEVGRQTRLLHRLANRLDSADARVRLIVTDISRILLVGDLAYKFKAALQRDVLDYSTLSARRHACEEELRLNRRLAPELYLGLASITGTRACPSIDGDGPVLEYAVRMR
ncbi:MAG: BON domain-containing protein, partial [Janthinobacterium sp.]